MTHWFQAELQPCFTSRRRNTTYFQTWCKSEMRFHSPVALFNWFSHWNEFPSTGFLENTCCASYLLCSVKTRGLAALCSFPHQPYEMFCLFWTHSSLLFTIIQQAPFGPTASVLTRLFFWWLNMKRRNGWRYVYFTLMWYLCVRVFVAQKVVKDLWRLLHW